MCLYNDKTLPHYSHNESPSVIHYILTYIVSLSLCVMLYVLILIPFGGVCTCGWRTGKQPCEHCVNGTHISSPHPVVLHVYFRAWKWFFCCLCCCRIDLEDEVASHRAGGGLRKVDRRIVGLEESVLDIRDQHMSQTCPTCSELAE